VPSLDAMHRGSVFWILVAVGLCLPAGVGRGQSAGDVALDLRAFPDGQGGTVNLTTECRSQCWGTCWCHGTMSAIESNLLASGNGFFAGSPWSEADDVDLSEYHLDKFNGANRRGEPGDETDAGSYPGQEPPWPGTNTDVPLADRTRDQGGGMPVHKGGDYKVVAAYLGNLGAVNETPFTRVTSSSQTGRDQFGYALDGIDPDPDHPAGFPITHEDYTVFMPRHVEWLTVDGSVEDKRTRIKEALVTGGAVATAVKWNSYSDTTGDMCYTGTDDVDHSVTIIGWDDSRQVTRSGQTHTGAWLCHNSWGSTWGKYGDGSFWVSYDDVHAAKHETMGGVGFRDVRPVAWSDVYSHSLHGWQFDTGADASISQAANRFVTAKDELLEAVAFYTVEEDVDYVVRVYAETLGSEAVQVVSGHFDLPGLHTVDLAGTIEVEDGEVFHVAVELTRDGATSPQAVDASNEMTAALGSPEDPPYDIYSAAGPNESFYLAGAGWTDFQDYDCYANLGIWDDGGALTFAADRRWNFAINAYAVARAATHRLAAPGAWSQAACWSDGVPDEAHDAVVDGGASVELADGEQATARRLYVGDAGAGAYHQLGGSLVGLEKVVLGSQAGASGTATIAGGTLEAEEVVIAGRGSGALSLAGGTLSVGSLTMGAGGSFAFTGGTLEAESIDFDLAQLDGTLRPGRSIGTLAIAGDYTLGAGVVHVELGGCDNGDPLRPQYDVLDVAGDVDFGGTLSLEWVPGEDHERFGGVYDVLVYRGSWSGSLVIDCDFAAYLIDANAAVDLGGGLSAVRIELAGLLDGDADLSGRVDRLDLLAVRAGFGSTQAGWREGDLNFDGAVDSLDYLAWKAHCGTSLGAAAPEPLTAVLLAVLLPAIRGRRRRISPGCGCSSGGTCP